MSLKEIETIKNFTKSVEKKFEEIKNFFTSLSVNNHSVDTSKKEKQLAEKGAIIDFLLNQKVRNEVDNNRIYQQGF